MTMRLYPFEDVAEGATRVIKQQGGTVYQQWLCEHCGVKQTMEEPNKFFTRGNCEECKQETNIRRNGCNYMVTFGVP